MTSMAPTTTLPLVERLATQLLQRQWLLATAESCTGGLIAAACTAVAGSSDWFERGFVTYSNAAKTEMLGVDPLLIATFGAVSPEVARAMAEGALAHSKAAVAVAVTGIAGPGGAVPGKPVGPGWFGFALPDRVLTEKMNFAGDRAAVRAATVRHALQRLTEMLS